jgi:ParB-like nuclease domain
MKTQTKIEMLETSALVPYARNARTHSPEQVAQIAASIREFGFTNPVLIDGQGGIVAGHGRVLAAQSLGVGSVPCLRVDWLTEAQRRAYILADNKLALQSGWDDEILKMEIKILEDEGFLALTGFDIDDLADLDGGQVSLELPDAPEPVTKNVADMEVIHAMRKKGNEEKAAKSDTEHYLVIVFDDRGGRESQLRKLGLPNDERYIHHRAVKIERRLGAQKTSITSNRQIKASSSKKSGATG